MCSVTLLSSRLDACLTPPAGSSKPRRRRLSTEERADRRRKRHRELVARGRARARHTIEALREEEAALHETMALLMVVARSEMAECPRATPRTQLVEAIMEQAALETSNDQLRNTIDAYVRFQRLVEAERCRVVPPDDACDTYVDDSLVKTPVVSRDQCERDKLATSVGQELGPSFWSVPASD